MYSNLRAVKDTRNIEVSNLGRQVRLQLNCIVLLLVISLLGGCTTIQFALARIGEPFERLNGIDHIGDSKANVLRVAGANYEAETHKTENGLVYEILTFKYSNGLLGKDKYSGVSVKIQVLVFLEDMLVSQSSLSSFKNDSTYFDIDRTSEIVSGMTVNDVVSILGNPSGFSILDENKLTYIYEYMKLSRSEVKSNTSTFEVFFDESGDGHIVSDIKLSIKPS